MKNKISSKSTITALLISAAIAVIFVFIGGQKVHYHMDEICTFGLSNGELRMTHEPGRVYSGSQLWQDYMTVDSGERFDYAKVWRNQADDVHPPLYYVIIHTISSLFPGYYSNLLGLLPNIFFAVVVFWQMYWLFGRFCDKKMALFASAAYLFTAAFVNIVVFFRMYAMLTVVTNLLFMLFAAYMPKDKKDKRFYIFMYLIIACGMLTHYYFAVICVLACFVYGVQMLFAKKTKDAVIFVATGIAAVATAAAVFPAMIRHIFFGYRGREAFGALVDGSIYSDISTVLGLADVYLFGGITIILAFAVAVIWLVNKEVTTEENSTIGYLLLQFVLPCLGYICIIAKVAPFKNERYITNVTAVIWFAVFAVALVVVKAFKTKGRVMAAAAALLIVVLSYQNGVPNMQKDDAWKSTILGNRTQLPCVFVYDASWQVIPNYPEIKNLEQITFLDPSTVDLIDSEEYTGNEAMLVFISDEAVGTEFLDRIVENSPAIEGYEMLYYSGYSACYLMD